MADIRRAVGNRIRKAREQRGKTLREVSDALDYDLSSLSKIERGEYEASYTVLSKLADYLNVNVGDFFGDPIEGPEELNADGILIAKEIAGSNLTRDKVEQIKQFINFTKNNS